MRCWCTWSVYRYSDAIESTPAQVRENLSKLWDEIRILTRAPRGERSAAGARHSRQGAEPLLSKLNIFSPASPAQLRGGASCTSTTPRPAPGCAATDKGIGTRCSRRNSRAGCVITCRENVNPEVDAEQVLEDVAHDNADVVFTTQRPDAPRLPESGSTAPRSTRFLNCSLNAPAPAGAHLLPPHL